MIPDNLVWTKAQIDAARQIVAKMCMLPNYFALCSSRVSGELGLDRSLPPSYLCRIFGVVTSHGGSQSIAMMVLWRSTAPAPACKIAYYQTVRLRNNRTPTTA
ncbi:hypothetical protein MGG_17797 [Pyricularia oryzae 70-15]|uniref:Uncharacterized protein n=2 Tax=Pyricularia oryzae TaxID=318829 RepID=G4NI21_PYRO7|nr:uncharacterized protein MGG_17797 [Pyricularia oryzae 70-15]EHA47881.1 hypothetical protein MGG_17797 [Pyricularia oryzae 70-15]KAI7918193.1 hypothetical protein M0657_007745 [Pyricularia oryzae]KAI7922049.1 hypothetical protein M9X92_005039 [Pyricularia oryzae]QBZ65115.1 hypothetical protein PoMZ_06819 [Pyricularia oryzae]